MNNLDNGVSFELPSEDVILFMYTRKNDGKLIADYIYGNDESPDVIERFIENKEKCDCTLLYITRD